MARKKAEEQGEKVSPPDDFVERVLRDVEKDYGQGVLVDGESAAAEKQLVIPVTPTLDIITSGGILEGSWVGITGNEKTGKAQPLHATVYTPDGPRPIGSLRVGDEVLTPHGGATRVVGVFPQGQKPIYRVTFVGGDSVECCADHLWRVKANQQKAEGVVPLSHIMAHLHDCPTDRRPKWGVPLPAPCEFRERSTELDPYLMGLLLGDGGLTRGTARFTTADEFLVRGVGKLVAVHGRSLTKVTGAKRDYSISRGMRGGKPSTQNEIPEEYLYNSAEKRLALLQGLMDSDGTVSVRGGASLSTSSPTMAMDFKELVESLGGLCRVRPKTSTRNGKKFRSWVCHVKVNDQRMLFRLPRKLKECRPRKKPPLRRRIVSADFIANVEAVCIKVEAADGLYLTDHFVVTHNTTLALTMAAQAQRPEYGSRPVYYGKIEGRLSLHHLKGIQGLDLRRGRFHILQSTPADEKAGRPARILTGNEQLRILENIIRTVPRAFVIIDSVSAFCYEEELTAGVGHQSRGGDAKHFAQFIRLCNQVLPVQKSIVVGITQLISNTSGMGAHYTERAARGFRYQCDYQLRTVGKEHWKVDGRPIGLKVKWACNTSPLGPPGMTIESHLRYGVGFDRLYEAVDLGDQAGLVKKLGTWYYLIYLDKDEYRHLYEGKDVPKAQGKENVYQLLLDNPEWARALEKEIAVLAGGLAGTEE